MKKAKRMELPREVWMGPEVLKKIPKTCQNLSIGKKSHIISGSNTYKIAGKKIEKSLKKSGFEVEHTIVSIADMKTAKELQKNIEETDFLLGVGGGTCIDMAK